MDRHHRIFAALVTASADAMDANRSCLDLLEENDGAGVSPAQGEQPLLAVEGFFAKLSKRRLKGGVFRSLADLQAAINRFLDEHNADPKPFRWTADPATNHRRRQTRAPSVGFDPLALIG